MASDKKEKVDPLIERLRLAKPVMLDLVGDNRGWKCVRKDAKKSSTTIEVREACRTEILDGKVKTFKYKLWRCTVDLTASVDAVEQMIIDTNKVKDWNPVVQFATSLAKPDQSTDILQYVFQPVAGGLISPREFITLCGREVLNKNGDHLLLAVGCEHVNAPLHKDRVRGWTGPSGFILKPNNQKNYCKLIWLINSDSRLPLALPSKIVDQAFIKLLLKMMRNLNSIFIRKNHKL